MILERIQQVKARVAECRARAAQHNLEMPDLIEVRFDLRGAAAGQAIRKGTHFIVRFNRDMMMNDGWDHLLKNTVPHELAHIWGFFSRQDLKHGPRWAYVCRLMGGDGQRLHKELVTYAKGKTYHYTTSTGHVVALSSIRHRKVQQGCVYNTQGQGVINRTCQYKVA